MGRLFLKLRNNIALESDLQLAERELKNLFRTVEAIKKEDTTNSIPHEIINSFCREGETIGYIVDGNKIDFKKTLILLSFIQEVWLNKIDAAEAKGILHSEYGDYICVVPMMAMAEFLSQSEDANEDKAKEIVYTLAKCNNSDVPASLVKTVKRSLSSTPHIHSFHAYKAKFFPRFVRSLIVANLNLQKEQITICDPFVGSGTTLVEAGLLGMDSVGIDIDPLSCFISTTKANALSYNPQDDEVFGFFDSITPNKQHHYKFPQQISAKFDRWGTTDERDNYESEISKELDAVEQERGFHKELRKIAISDALTRKFNVRMMGTGSGRFALDIGKKSLSSIISADIKNEYKALKVIATLKSLYGLEIKMPKVHNGDATQRPIDDSSVDIIVTSPPYIPASSGREDYLVGKLTSLTALDMMNNDMNYYLKKSVGSMDSEEEDMTELPKEVKDLVSWLLTDELRKVKAKPIISYYNSIRKSLIEDKRCIKDDGTIIYVIGKETIFYSMSTREILYKVECDSIFRKIAESVGLKIVDSIDIELDKKNLNARPRSTDKYYECAIIMKK